MENSKVSEAVRGRDDISPFLVHLTRDNSESHPDGKSARKNLVSIYNTERVRATGHHCLYSHEIRKLSTEIENKCKVTCFTEVPLSQLGKVVRDIPGRKIKLEPYGLVFSKKTLVAAGAQPAIYVNSYPGFTRHRAAYREMFNVAKKDPSSKFWEILPFVNVMNEKHDFAWEREWRVLGEFKFDRRNLVCVILPESGEDKIRKQAAKSGLAVISPGLNYEQIIAALSTQQKKTKALLKA